MLSIRTKMIAVISIVATFHTERIANNALKICILMNIKVFAISLKMFFVSMDRIDLKYSNEIHLIQ
jgi:hypothetical protein